MNSSAARTHEGTSKYPRNDSPADDGFGHHEAGLGASLSEAGVTFKVFSAHARHCEVRLFDESGTRAVGHRRLSPVGNGFFSARLPLSEAREGTLYSFVLDGRGLPDPYARELPFGVHGPARVTKLHHQWRNPPVSRRLREHVIYELHVGTFTEAGTYAGVRERLPELVALGITAIELMPLASFAGQRGWGYDGVALFAPHAAYGTPDELCALIDDAHGVGLSVFLDVVYNHFGAVGNYLSEYSRDYFTSEFKNGWGDAPNFRNPVMRRLVIDNALHWLTEFRFDGLRLDAIHAIHDPSPRHILKELAEEVHALHPHRLLIGEDDRNDPAAIDVVGLDAVWADDFHHQVRVTLTGEQDGYYASYQPSTAAIAQAIRQGWLYCGQRYPLSGKSRGRVAEHLPAEAFVYCLQNHDQIGNRAFGDRLNHQISPQAYRAVSTLLLFLPATPLLFMGQEWAASTPFQYFTNHEGRLGELVSEGRREEFRKFRAFSDPEAYAKIPDPQDQATFLRSTLQWNEREGEEHGRTLSLYRQLIRLRRVDPVLRSSGRKELEAEAQGSVLAVRRWSASDERLLLVNLSSEAVPLSSLVPSPARRPLLFHSADGRLENELPGYTAVILGRSA